VSQPFETYIKIVVETFKDSQTGKVRVRPALGAAYPQTMQVECPRPIRYKYPLGTKFRITVKLTDREGGKPFLYSHHSWSMQVLS